MDLTHFLGKSPAAITVRGLIFLGLQAHHLAHNRGTKLPKGRNRKPVLHPNLQYLGLDSHKPLCMRVFRYIHRQTHICAHVPTYMHGYIQTYSCMNVYMLLHTSDYSTVRVQKRRGGVLRFISARDLCKRRREPR